MNLLDSYFFFKNHAIICQIYVPKHPHFTCLLTEQRTKSTLSSHSNKYQENHNKTKILALHAFPPWASSHHMRGTITSPIPFDAQKTKGGEKGEKKIKTNGIVPFLSQMLFSHVLPQDQTLPLSVILPPFLL